MTILRLPTHAGLRVLEGEEEAKVIAQVCQTLQLKPRVRDVAHWERGWKENLVEYLETGNLDALKPKYIRPGLPLRCDSRFVIAEDPDYEWNWYKMFREKIAQRWLIDAPVIVEFGSGSGHNLAWLKQRYPDKGVFGCDWSPAAVQIASRVADGGDVFNMLEPGKPRTSMRDMTVLTVGTMEQLGPERWRPMLDFLLAAKPQRVVHIEPVLDWYDAHNPVDATAIEAHRARGFWEGYIEALIELMNEEKVDIEYTQRSYFGSLLTEGYSLLVWRPL